MTGNAPGQLSPDQLLDVADECDPDDTFLYSELEALGTSLASTAAFADRLWTVPTTRPPPSSNCSPPGSGRGCGSTRIPPSLTLPWG